MAVSVGKIEAQLDLEDRMSKKIKTATKNLGGFRSGVKNAISVMAGFVGAQAIMSGVGAAFSFAKDSAIGMNATLETTTLQFETLMGDADEAEAHVASLFEFAKKTPFETGPIIEASRMMRTFGGAALDTKENLNLIGDASAATGAPINELGFWIGRLNALLQGGKAFGEASMRLQELAVLSAPAREEMERLQRAGGDASAIFTVFQKDLGKFSGGMTKMAATWEGVTSTFIDTVQLTISDAFKPLFEFLRDGIGVINDLLGSEQMEAVPKAIAKSIMDAFGNDPRQAVLKMIDTLLNWGVSTLEVGKQARVGFNGFILSLRGLAVAVLTTAEAVNLIGVTIGNIVYLLTGGWSKAINDTVYQMQEFAFTLDDANQEQQYWFGQTAKNINQQGEWDRAMDSGIEMLEGMRGQVDKLSNNLPDLEEGTEDAANATEELAGNVKQLTEEQDKLVKGWQQGEIPAAKDLMIALENVGGITKLTEAEKKSLNATLEAAILKYQALGEEAPQAMREVAAATRETLESSQLLDENVWVSMYTMPGGFMASIDKTAQNIQNSILRKGGLPALGLDIQGGISTGPQMVSTGAMLGTSLKEGLFENLKDIPDTISKAFTGGGNLFGALKAIGSQIGSTVGGSVGGAWGASVASKEGVGKLMKGFANLAGPIGMAVGALAGPLIGGLKKLFGGPTVAESVRKAGSRMFEKGISEGLSKAIEKTRESTASDFGAMMMHMADIIEEQGGVIAMGMDKAISSVRDIFVALETGAITSEQAATTFGASFNKIASAMVESGGIATENFTELIALAERFGTTGETIKFVGEQATAASVGIAALFGPTIEEAKGYNAELKKNREAWEKIHPPLQKALDDYEKVAASFKKGKASQEDLDRASEHYNQTLERYHDLAAEEIDLREKLNTLAGKSQDELEDLGTIAVASFSSAVAAGMSFLDAVKAHGPALDAITDAQKELGITSENVAVQELSAFQDRIRNNSTLVTAVEALDDTMLALSRTGSLNAETLGAMERQGVRMYDQLIEKGFSQEQAVLMMGPALKTIMEAHEKLGIPVDENTQKLIDQAKEAGHLEDEQKSGWAAVESAVGSLISKMDELITKLMGVKDKVEEIPTELNIAARVNYETGKMNLGTGTGLDFTAQHGGIVTRPAVGLVGEAGPEAIIPLTHLEQRDRALLAEVRGLKTELRNLPIHLRDAIILAQ